MATRRNAIDALPPNIKSLNYLNNILAKIEANAKGGDEAIFLDQNGYVSEGSGEYIYMVTAFPMVPSFTLELQPENRTRTVLDYLYVYP